MGRKGGFRTKLGGECEDKHEGLLYCDLSTRRPGITEREVVFKSNLDK